MTWRFAVCLTLAVTLLSPAVAQEEGGRGQRGGQRGGGGPGGGGFGGGMGMMMGRGGGAGGASSIIGLLRIEEVRKEVGVTEDVYKTVSEGLQDDMRKLMSRDTSEEDRKKISQEANEKAESYMEEILTPDKQLRLKGLYAQNSGARAVLNTVIAKEIGLSETDRASLEKDLAAEMEKSGEKMRELFGGGSGERPDRTKIQEAMSKMQEDSLKFVEGKLTAEQKAALEKLKGEKFKFPEPRGFGFGGPGGDGGRGGEGGRPRNGEGGRPRGDGN